MIDAYRIGVSIAMTNGMSGVLAVIQRDVLGLHRSVNMVNGGFSKMKVAVAGLAGVTVGAGMLAGLYELSKASEKYTHQLEMLRGLANITPIDLEKSIKAANDISSQVTTSTPTANLQTIGELRSVFANIDDAIKFLPQMQKLSAVFASLTGGVPEKLGYTTMRAVEMLGGTVNPKTGKLDTDRAAGMVDLIAQAAIASHGTVGPQQWMQFAQQASGVVKNMDPSALILGMMPIIQEMGGMRAGTALTSMNQQIVGGVMPQRVAKEWEKFGLLDMQKVSETKTGIQVAPGGVKGEDVWKTAGPIAWIESVFIPQLQKAGVSQEGISDQIIRLMSRQTSQREASLMATQLVRINKDVLMAQQAAKTAPGAKELLQNDPNTARAALAAQWDRALTDLGRALTPAVVSIMRDLTGALRYFGEVVEVHPTATKWILGIAAGLAAVLAVAGTVAIVVAAIAAIGPIGWIAAGITAVGVAITAIGVAIASNWDRIKDFGAQIGEALGRITSAIWKWIKSPFEAGSPSEMPADWKPAHVGNPGSLSQRLHDSPAFQANMHAVREGAAGELRTAADLAPGVPEQQTIPTPYDIQMPDLSNLAVAPVEVSGPSMDRLRLAAPTLPQLGMAPITAPKLPNMPDVALGVPDIPKISLSAPTMPKAPDLSLAVPDVPAIKLLAPTLPSMPVLKIAPLKDISLQLPDLPSLEAGSIPDISVRAPSLPRLPDFALPKMPQLQAAPVPDVSLRLPDLPDGFAPMHSARRVVSVDEERNSLARPDTKDEAQPAMTDQQADHIGTVIVNAMKRLFGDVHVDIDGRKLGKLIFQDLGLAPPNSGSNFDTRMSPLFPATGYK